MSTRHPAVHPGPVERVQAYIVVIKYVARHHNGVDLVLASDSSDSLDGFESLIPSAGALSVRNGTQPDPDANQMYE